MYIEPIPHALSDKKNILSFFLNHLNSPKAVIPKLTPSISVIFISSVSFGMISVANKIKLIKISIDAAIPMIFLPSSASVSVFCRGCLYPCGFC